MGPGLPSYSGRVDDQRNEAIAAEGRWYLQSFFWEESEVNQRLHRLVVRSFQEVLACAEREEVGLREAAYMLGVGRVAEAVRARGIYP